MKDFSNFCILIPSFNPDENLYKLLNELYRSKWGRVIIIDDGSSNESKQVFEDLANLFELDILYHDTNKGKGAALKTGFDFIKTYSTNFDGVITVDADGQHLVDDIEKIAHSANQAKSNVVFGVRKFGNNTPFASLFGNKVTRYLLHAMNNLDIDDTQTGLRYLPIDILDKLLLLPGMRYEYELECLITINNLGYNIIQIQIKTVYLNQNKGSHFRGLLDSTRVLLIFIRYSVISLSSFGIDILFFAILLSFYESIFQATIIARIISGSFNFILNKLVTFKSYSRSNIIKQIFQYLFLGAMLALLSAQIVGISEGVALHSTLLLKVLVDTSLFFIAFYVQKSFIFKN
jgi:putative flippase GtrA